MKEYKIRIRISWFETDAAKVVHFSNYFRYLERAEMEFLRSTGIEYKEIMRAYGIWLPRVEAACKFISPCYFDDELEIKLVVGELKDKSIRYNFQVTNTTTGKLAAEGYMVVVSVSADTNRPVSLPLNIVESLRGYARESKHK